MAAAKRQKQEKVYKNRTKESLTGVKTLGKTNSPD